MTVPARDPLIARFGNPPVTIKARSAATGIALTPFCLRALAYRLYSTEKKRSEVVFLKDFQGLCVYWLKSFEEVIPCLSQ